MINRRKFLHLSALAAPLLATKKTLANNFDAITKPIVISTWDSGMPVNAAAWEILSASGLGRLESILLLLLLGARGLEASAMRVELR